MPGTAYMKVLVGFPAVYASISNPVSYTIHYTQYLNSPAESRHKWQDIEDETQVGNASHTDKEYLGPVAR